METASNMFIYLLLAMIIPTFMCVVCLYVFVRYRKRRHEKYQRLLQWNEQPSNSNAPTLTVTDHQLGDVEIVPIKKHKSSSSSSQNNAQGGTKKMSVVTTMDTGAGVKLPSSITDAYVDRMEMERLSGKKKRLKKYEKLTKINAKNKDSNQFLLEERERLHEQDKELKDDEDVSDDEETQQSQPQTHNDENAGNDEEPEEDPIEIDSYSLERTQKWDGALSSGTTTGKTKSKKGAKQDKNHVEINDYSSDSIRYMPPVKDNSTTYLTDIPEQKQESGLERKNITNDEKKLIDLVNNSLSKKPTADKGKINGGNDTPTSDDRNEKFVNNDKERGNEMAELSNQQIIKESDKET
ncbi:eukaryotic translation initiation factor 3 subunit 8 [Reticulomyxa filosa]|uniref:Eukaryotic translation initiation factor 3 subunit 8 n=1 Tax=Reticulomyxa filosa TaxID=46433 RepID=X6NKZ6_RETFI|nr:eukaryotic translation initiation factor 3 subunit 8 [Reticulomyxa filosa]|eukprot:ETO26950.1 eukaryotic translation initiation factor 3 subunit 8 [Reticulomyxa filosa]